MTDNYVALHKATDWDNKKYEDQAGLIYQQWFRNLLMFQELTASAEDFD